MRFSKHQRIPGETPIGALLALPLFFLPAGAYLIERGLIDLGTCGMKKAFEIPCLSCGATRATLRLFHGDVLGAIALQPMMMMIYLFLAVWGLVSFGSFAVDKRVRMHLSDYEDIGIKVAFVTIPLVNWAYLIWAGI